MNNVALVGRLTRDPEVRYTPENLAVARFSIAINRTPGRNGEDRGADFPNIVVFGKQAENCEKFLTKGKQVAIQGHIQTGSYKGKDGKRVYTTDVVTDRVEFLGSKQDGQQPSNVPEGFTAIDDDDIPF